MIICASCGCVPAKCSCEIPSPLQKLVEKQRADASLWYLSGSETCKNCQEAIRELHEIIEKQRTTGI